MTKELAFAEKNNYTFPVLGDYTSKTIKDYDVLLQDISDYIRVLKEEGDILLSGFYDEDVRVLATKLESLDLSLVNSDYRNNWSVLHFRK